MPAKRDSPWEHISRPRSGAPSYQRIDDENPWDLYWGRDPRGWLLFALRHRTESSDHVKLPQLRDLVVEYTDYGVKGIRLLQFSLRDLTQDELFERLCRDIAEAVVPAVDEADAVRIMVDRAWRWHYLLRGGDSGVLSVEEQKGLIGELFVLDEVMLEAMSADDAVASWIGPLDSPKDFQVGLVAVESKARRSGSVPHVSISSEDQLDPAGLKALFLSVVELDRAGQEMTDAFTLTEIVNRVRARLLGKAGGSIDVFDGRLTAVGYRPSDDYSDWVWLEGTSRLYRVGIDFPMVAGSTVRPGVSRVRYNVSLPDCEPFEVERAVLIEMLRGVDHE